MNKTNTYNIEEKSKRYNGKKTNKNIYIETLTNFDNSYFPRHNLKLKSLFIQFTK